MSGTYGDEIDRITKEIEVDTFNLEVKKGVLVSLIKMASGVKQKPSDDKTRVTELGPTNAIKRFFTEKP